MKRLFTEKEVREIIGKNEEIITRNQEDFNKIEHEWTLDFTRNDTGNTKVYKCKKECGARKENNVIYFEDCDGDEWSTNPCLCSKGQLARAHLSPVDNSTIVNKKTINNQLRQEQLAILDKMLKEGGICLK